MSDEREKTKKVCVKFELSESEAKRLCEIRFEPKPSTAAAQVVRMVIRKEGGR